MFKPLDCTTITHRYSTMAKKKSLMAPFCLKQTSGIIPRQCSYLSNFFFKCDIEMRRGEGKERETKVGEGKGGEEPENYLS